MATTATNQKSVSKSVSIQIPQKDGQKLPEVNPTTAPVSLMQGNKLAMQSGSSQARTTVKKQIQQQPVDGFRNFETQELHLLQAIKSNTFHTKEINCTTHKFCGREIRLLEDTGVDDTCPPFVWVEQTNNTDDNKKKQSILMNRETKGFNQKNWPQRNHILKQRLLFEGKVRSKEGEYDGASMIIPTKDTLEAWVEQSKIFGASLNNKARDNINQSPNRTLGQGQTSFMDPYDAIEIDPRMNRMGAAMIMNTNRTDRSDGFGAPPNRINFTSQQLRVERFAAPQLPMNPNINQNIRMKGDDAYLSHFNHYQEQLVVKEREKLGRGGTLDQQQVELAARRSRTSPKYVPHSQILKEQEDKAIEELNRKKDMEEAEKLRPVTMIRARQGHRFIRKVQAGDEMMIQELDQQKQVKEMHASMKNQSDPSGESNVLIQKKRSMRGATSQPAITEPKTRKDHIFGTRDRTKAIKRIEKGTESVYGIYDENRRLASAKERLRKMGQKAWGRKNENDEDKWDINGPALYQYDLRGQLQVQPASDDLIDRRNAQKLLIEKQQKWKGLVGVQDNLEKLRRRAEQQLINISTKLNPLYDMEDLRKDHKMAQTKDYIKEEANAKKRVNLVQKKGMEQRVESYKEELRSYQYMVDKGLIKEAKTKEELQAAVKQFKEMTSKHPQRSVEAALAKLNAKNDIYRYGKKDDTIVDDNDDDELLKSQATALDQPPNTNKLESNQEQAKTGPQSKEASQRQTPKDSLSAINSQKQQPVGTIKSSQESNRNQDQNFSSQSTREQNQSGGQPNSSKFDATIASGSQAGNDNGGTTTKSQMKGARKSATNQKKLDTYMDPEFWYHKGVVLNQSENEAALASALKCYKQALKLNPSHTPSIFNLACNYEKNEQHAEAKEQFEKAIKVREDWPDAYYGLTLTCIKLGLTNQAVIAIEKAIHYTKANGVEVPAQILYVRALAYKVDLQLDQALEHYQVIMKDDETKWDYYEMIQKENQEMLKQHMMADPSSLDWKIDLFHTFKQKGILKTHEPKHAINFWQYYEENEGWSFDKIPQVLNLLQKIRFFVRFESDQLQRFLCKVTLRTVKKGTLLFLQEDEAAVIVAGQLYLFNHAIDVACPSVQAIFNAGDILGISEISNGWTRQQHDWIVAENDCDVFVCSREYLTYMWHIMKVGLQNQVVDMLKQSTAFAKLSEQTLYTIANDMSSFKEFDNGEVICHQDQKSQYNVNYLLKELNSIKELKNKDSEYLLSQKLTQRFNYPTLKKAWEDQQVKKDWNQYLNDKKREQELAQATGSVKKQLRQANQGKVGATKMLTTDDTVSEDFPLSGGRQSNVISPKVALTDEEVKQLKEQERVIGEYKARAVADDRICRSIVGAPGVVGADGADVSRFDQIRLKVQKYRNEREALPQDADGIYFIVSGTARIINAQDQNDYNALKLGVGEYFGTSKYILSQGYTYFGDIIADKEQVQKESNKSQANSTSKKQVTTQPSLLNAGGGSSSMQPNNRRQQSEGFGTRGTNRTRATDKDLSQSQQKQKKDAAPFTTCLYMPHNKLHLIPFYDYYNLRDFASSKPEFNQLRSHPKINGYLKMIRTMNKIIKKDAE